MYPSGLSAELTALRRDVEERWPGRPFLIAALLGGRSVFRWNHGLGRRVTHSTASVAKSLHASMLGIAVGEGVVGSAEDRIADYYPQMAEVPPGSGPKSGRHNTEGDRDITFRQALSHRSGYLKPDEAPGQTFHYQTYAVNVAAHALATAYGYYVPGAVGMGQPTGIGDLVSARIRDPIGASWTWHYRNFSNLSPEAKLDVFGNSVHFCTSIDDLLRLGWLWACDGGWFGDQVIPEGWIADCVGLTRPVPVESGIQSDYGCGFWINRGSALWPDLPERSFAAWGRGGHNVWVAPDIGLVIATSPLPMGIDESDGPETIGERVVPEIVRIVTEWQQ